MIDIRLVRDDPDVLKVALGRRGVPEAEIDALAELDARHRERLGRQESLRARVKALSREVAQAKRSGAEKKAEALAEESRRLGADERSAAGEADLLGQELRRRLLDVPNVPADEAPSGAGPEDNVELRRWWPGKEEGRAEPVPADHQRVPHWEVGEELGILDMERGSRIAGSMFPLFRGMGAGLLRALTSFALDRHHGAYEEVRPPTLVLTETMTASGHLPKFADDAYHLERDDLWAIPTSEVPLASMHRGEILDEEVLPLRFTSVTPCFRREAGAAGRETRGLLRVHEFDKVELFAYTTPDQWTEVHADMMRRAEELLQELGLTYRVVDLCAGDLGTASARTFDLEVHAPGSDRWLEVSSVSWCRDYQARRASIRYRQAGSKAPSFVHTLNGSALAWPRVWAALIETGRQADGSVRLPACLALWLGGRLEIPAPSR
jgi:seryl-tRNA synthetase